jgi:uncharacterized membrane protein YtjA (UPF0391 family)
MELDGRLRPLGGIDRLKNKRVTKDYVPQNRDATKQTAAHFYPVGACATSIFRRAIMLRYAIIFLVIALVAGVLGFGGIAGASVGIAKILFIIFLILFAISAVMHVTRKV